MSGVGEQLETILREMITESISETDISDEVEKAVDNYDFSDAIRDAVDFSDQIHDAMREYEWWDEIESQAKDEIEQQVENVLAGILSSPEFKEAVKRVLLEIGKDICKNILDTVRQAGRDVLAGVKGWIRYPFHKSS